MVSLKDIRSSNTSLQDLPPGIVAVFVGATSGIGLGTLEALAKNGNGPRTYIITRSAVKATPIIERLKKVNPMATFMAIEGQFSLIRDVDKMCDEIKKFETHIDILFMSPGYPDLGKRHETKEGIDTDLALQYYSRLRLTTNLLPLLERSSSPRVISILAPGFEGPLTKTDLSLSNPHSYNPIKALRAASTMTTLIFEELATSHPSITFIHSYPGQIGSRALSHTLSLAPSLLYLPAQLAKFTILPVYEHLMCISPSEAGERTLFLGISTRFPPASDHGSTGKIDGFVERPPHVGVARSTVMREGRGNGVFRVNWNQEVCGESGILESAREEGMGREVLEHTRSVWEGVVNGK